MLGIGVLFGAHSLVELPRDGEKHLAGFAHGCTSSERPGVGAWQGEGWPRAAPVLGGNIRGPCGDVPA